MRIVALVGAVVFMLSLACGGSDTNEPTAVPMENPTPSLLTSTPSAKATATPTTESTTVEPMLTAKPTAVEPVPTADPTTTSTPEVGEGQWPFPQFPPEPVIVDIRNFVHKDLVIPRGTTVTWINRDAKAHTTRSGLDWLDPDDIWNSDTIESGDSFSVLFSEVGTFPYYCAFHSNMLATVTVVPSDT